MKLKTIMTYYFNGLIYNYDNFLEIYISLFLNKPLEYLGIENYKAIYKYI